MSGSGNNDSGDGARSSGASDDFLRDVGDADDPAKLAHFKVLDRLGQGGMGIVYRAQDEKLGRVVALKVLPPEFEADDAKRQRLLREARVAAAVTHPNLATVYEVGESEGRIFIAMELVEGRPLRDLMAAGPLPVATALSVMRQVAAGVARAHAAGIVHRDLKPENILVADDGHVKVLDFGLAKRPGADGQLVTATGEFMFLGTPAYMAPEQARGQTVTPASDVFALGVVIHEILTGQRPFTGKNLPQLIRAIERDTPPAPSTVHPLVPAAVDAIVARCLAKDPAERYPSAQGLLEELRQLETASARAALQSTLAQPAGNSLVTPAPSTTLPRSAGSRRRLAIGLASAVGILGAVGIVATRPSRPVVVPPMSAPASPPPVRAITLADLPLPASTVAEAVTEYKAGLQLQRDGSDHNARLHYMRAAELDPSMAAAHLRLAIEAADHEKGRESFAKAAALRAALPEHERVLLEALEPFAGRMQPDRLVAIQRLQAASDRDPQDVEFLDWTAELEGDPDQRAVTAQRAVELDPLDGQGLRLLGQASVAKGDFAEARRIFERCAAISSESSDCRGQLLGLDASEGRCDLWEANARRLADQNPTWGYWAVAEAILARDGPEEAYREAIMRAEEGATPPRKADPSRIDASLAIRKGRFDVARSVFDRIATKGRDNWGDAADVFDRTELLLEIGAAATARTIAAEFLDRVQVDAPPADLVGSGAEWVGRPWWLLSLAERPLDPGRARWVEDQFRQEVTLPSVWFAGWAWPARTPEQARAALDALVQDPRLKLPVAGDGFEAGVAGHTFVLAGRPAEALPYLRQAAVGCWVRADSFKWVQTQLDLGGALEATGDPHGACDAYGEVLRRWGNAVPRSISAEAARDGLKRLRCVR